MRVVVIGSGNVAESLAQAIAEAEGLELVQVFARNEERGRKVAELAHSEWSNTSLAEADLYLISVSDNAVAGCAKELHIPQNAVIAHTAGCCPMEALAPHTHRAVFYPFQTFFDSFLIQHHFTGRIKYQFLHTFNGTLTLHIKTSDGIYLIIP